MLTRVAHVHLHFRAEMILSSVQLGDEDEDDNDEAGWQKGGSTFESLCVSLETIFSERHTVPYYAPCSHDQ